MVHRPAARRPVYHAATTEEPPMIIVSGRATCRPGTVEQVWSLIAAVVPPTRAEAGCGEYTFFADPARPDSIFVYEEWASDEAIAAHLQAPHTQQFLGAVFPLLAEPPALKRHDVASSGPLFP
jgi:quinol monooxygenase YgiN